MSKAAPDTGSLNPEDRALLCDLAVRAKFYAERETLRIPSSLKSHQAAIHLQAYIVTGSVEELDRAAENLVPNDPEHAWLALTRS